MLPLPATLEAAARWLAAGGRAAALVEAALDRAADPGGEGGRAFLRLHAGPARAAAGAFDALRAAGLAPSPWAGVPVTVKDLFDEAGLPTRGGSRALADAPPAPADAPAVARLRRMGFVVIGRTAMSEFAFSGLGLNAHHPAPRAPWRRGEGAGRIPGGSSSGAAVAVADGLGLAGLGTDTGGSCRIPAALCGVVGFKPTARRVPLAGVLPLSPTLDSVGPLASSVACCATIDALLAGGEAAPPLDPPPPAALRLALPRGSFLLDSMEPGIAGTFGRAVARLAAAGARIEDVALPELADIPAANARGGFAAAEAWAWHRGLVAARGADYDSRILARIRRGEAIGAADHLALVAERARLIAALDRRLAGFDALLCPTVPLAPPPVAALEADGAEYDRVNLLLLRNPAVANFLDRCAVSLPCHEPGAAPCGLMLTGAHGADRALLAAAAAVEAVLAG